MREEETFGREAACRVGPILVTSRIMGKDPDTGHMPSDPDAQAELCFKNLKRVLAELDSRNVRVAGAPGRIRVATHIFTQSTELNALFDGVERGLRK